MSSDEQKREHPSYGVIRVTNVTGHHNLFGSRIETGHAIRMEIAQAHANIRHGEESYDGADAPFLTVEMSELQWARMISSIGHFSGSPCTIRRREGKMVPGETRHDVSIEDKAYNRIRAEVKKATEKLEGEIADAKQLIASSKMPKKAISELMEHLDSIRRTMNDTLPFVGGIIENDAHNATHEAYSEIDAYAQRIVHSVRHEVERHTTGTISNKVASALMGMTPRLASDKG